MCGKERINSPQTYLFATTNFSFGKYNDAAFTINIDHFGDTIRITRMIYVPC